MEPLDLGQFQSQGGCRSKDALSGFEAMAGGDGVQFGVMYITLVLMPPLWAKAGLLHTFMASA